MPRSSALAFTACKSCSGRRMFNWADFGAISNRIGWKSEKSYSDRSAVATKFSASSSVLNSGNFFSLALAITHDLLVVHEARADRTDQFSPFILAKRVDPENETSRFIPAHRPKSSLR